MCRCIWTPPAGPRSSVSQRSRRRDLRCMVAIGLSALLLFHWMGGGIPPLGVEALPALMVYWVLPAIGVVHFLYLTARAFAPRALAKAAT